jgi:hypothetical protein
MVKISLLKKEKMNDEEFDKLVWARYYDISVIDKHSLNCIRCDLRTDFIFSRGLCELCKENALNRTGLS